MGSPINLHMKAKQLVLQDIHHQDPSCGVRDGDLVLVLFERRKNLWTALVELIETEALKVRERFYEVTYFLDQDTAHVTTFTVQTTNPYKL